MPAFLGGAGSRGFTRVHGFTGSRVHGFTRVHGFKRVHGLYDDNSANFCSLQRSVSVHTSANFIFIPRQIGERPGASGGSRLVTIFVVTIFQGASGSKL